MDNNYFVGKVYQYSETKAYGAYIIIHGITYEVVNEFKLNKLTYYNNRYYLTNSSINSLYVKGSYCTINYDAVNHFVPPFFPYEFYVSNYEDYLITFELIAAGKSCGNDIISNKVDNDQYIGYYNDFSYMGILPSASIEQIFNEYTTDYTLKFYSSLYDFEVKDNKIHIHNLVKDYTFDINFIGLVKEEFDNGLGTTITIQILNFDKIQIALHPKNITAVNVESSIINITDYIYITGMYKEDKYVEECFNEKTQKEISTYIEENFGIGYVPSTLPCDIQRSSIKENTDNAFIIKCRLFYDGEDDLYKPEYKSIFLLLKDGKISDFNKSFEGYTCHLNNTRIIINNDEGEFLKFNSMTTKLNNIINMFIPEEDQDYTCITTEIYFFGNNLKPYELKFMVLTNDDKNYVAQGGGLKVPVENIKIRKVEILEGLN